MPGNQYLAKYNLSQHWIEAKTDKANYKVAFLVKPYAVKLRKSKTLDKIRH